MKTIDGSQQAFKIDSAVFTTVAVGAISYMAWPFVVTAISTIAVGKIVGWGTVATGAFVVSKLFSDNVAEKEYLDKDGEEQ